MPLLPLDIPPGLYANGTDVNAAGRWRDGNLIRWRDKALRPIGGWEASTDFPTTYGAACRGSWVYETSAIALRFLIGNTTTLYRGDEVMFSGLSGNADQSASGFASTWALDNFGIFGVACQDTDGRILRERIIIANPDFFEVIPDAPTGVSSIIVTAERFLMALGKDGNERLVAWSDREDYETWTPAATNQAGEFTLQTPGSLMQGIRVPGQTLILTNRDAHTATYQGPPFVYGFERVGSSCGSISRKAAVAAAGGAFWMGFNSFFAYLGGRVETLDCDVADQVFQNINFDQRSKVWAFDNSENNEVWWFYPTSNEIDRYVSFNYETGSWSFGSMVRTTGVSSGSLLKPHLCDASGDVFVHETGYSYGGATPYAETGPISLGAGDRLMSVTSLIPDEQTQGDVTATFKTRNYPNGPETSYGPYSLDDPTDVRFTGRQVRMRVTGNNATDWRVGINRLDVRSRGKR